MLIERIPLKTNEGLLLDYWRNNLPKVWMMDPDAILRFAGEAVGGIWLYAAYVDGHCCGLLANEEGVRSGIWLLHVRQENRLQGIGTKLLDCASKYVEGDWYVGSGTGYWWQGAPVGCGDEFLSKRGFIWTWTSVDMVLDLRSWTSPPSANPPLTRLPLSEPALADISIGRLSVDDAGQLIDMVESESYLSGWTQYYQSMVDDDRNDEILIASDANRIVGCAMILPEVEIRWRSLCDGRIGGIGCLGVREADRGKGVGMALAVAVTSELKSAGYGLSYVGYTWLEEWYSKIGYKTVFRQKMGYRTRSFTGTRG